MASMTETVEVAGSMQALRRPAPHVVNRIMGTILAVKSAPHHALLVRVDDGGQFDVSIDHGVCMPVLQPFLATGNRVFFAIQAADVKLYPPLPRNVRGCNEWPARVVLVEDRQDRTVVTVKIIGQQITLKSVDVPSWLTRPVRVWDALTMRIAPEAMRVIPLGTAARLRQRCLTPNPQISPADQFHEVAAATARP